MSREKKNEEIPQSDKEVLRELGKRIYEIATSPLNEEYVELQRNINNLRTVKPIIYVYEIPWHEMDVYGEPLHHKVNVLKRNIPRLRRISISPFADFQQAAENIQDKFVIAWKPNPAVLAASAWIQKPYGEGWRRS